MAEIIALKALVEKLNSIFCEENKREKKYSEVWLSEVDYNGIYQIDKYDVNVKAEHQIESCNEEIYYIVTELFKLLTKQEMSLLWRVTVYNSNEEIHCQSSEEDLLVYNSENACP
ncbi:MAG: hypothetical protein ABIX01_00115 [Chitinophagaceae bacterium]